MFEAITPNYPMKNYSYVVISEVHILGEFLFNFLPDDLE